MSRFYFEEHYFNVRLSDESEHRVKVLGVEPEFFRVQLLDEPKVLILPKTSILWMEILEKGLKEIPSQPNKAVDGSKATRGRRSINA